MSRTASTADINVESSEAVQTIFCVNHNQNPRFVERPNVFEILDRAIEENISKAKPKLLTLCGLGGMGKSQIALEFCHRNRESYQYIFWMEADTEETLQTSFKAAAEELPDFADKTSEKVVREVIRWFEKNSGWLIVFDNADDYSLGSTSNRRLQ